MNDYERMRQRHHDGMCGGACAECEAQHRREHEEYRAREAAEEDYRRDEADALEKER